MTISDRLVVAALRAAPTTALTQLAVAVEKDLLTKRTLTPVVIDVGRIRAVAVRVDEGVERWEDRHRSFTLRAARNSELRLDLQSRPQIGIRSTRAVVVRLGNLRSGGEHPEQAAPAAAVAK